MAQQEKPKKTEPLKKPTSTDTNPKAEIQRVFNSKDRVKSTETTKKKLQG